MKAKAATAAAGSGRNRPDSNRLARAQVVEQAALLVASGISQVEISRRLEVSDRVLRRWGHSQLFQGRVAELRRQIVDQTIGKLVTTSTSAIETLKDLLLSDDEKIKLGAAAKILDVLAKSREGAEFADEPTGPIQVTEVIIRSRQEAQAFLEAIGERQRPAISGGTNGATHAGDTNGEAAG